MMRAKTERMVKRWGEQRWALDSIIQAVGMEWDQPRLGYTMYPAGPDAIGDFRTVGLRVKKFADMHRELGAAGRRRQAKAEAFEKQGRKVAARESDAAFVAFKLYPRNFSAAPMVSRIESSSTKGPGADAGSKKTPQESGAGLPGVLR